MTRRVRATCNEIDSAPVVLSKREIKESLGTKHEIARASRTLKCETSAVGRLNHARYEGVFAEKEKILHLQEIDLCKQTDVYKSHLLDINL